MRAHADHGRLGRDAPRCKSVRATAALALAGCTEDATGEGEASSGDEDTEPLPPRQLVSADGWGPTAAADDVFAAMKPGRTECVPVESYGAIDFGGYPAFEVHTDFCDYATVTQAIFDDIHAGEHVNVRMWHFDLRSPEPAEGYVAVAVEGEVRWEYTVAIPSDGALASYGWITDHDLLAGTPVQFHVHNHGINSWNLIEITAGAPEG